MNHIYMDYNATAPMRVEASAVMMEVAERCYANASSTHGPGREARRCLDDARTRLADLLGVSAREVLFTAGGTEGDNIAIQGIAAGRSSGHVITSSIEHPAVLETCRMLEARGIDVTYLDVDAAGVVDPDMFRSAFRDDTMLASIMWVNNETGTIQPIAELAALAEKSNVPFHTDAVQAFGRIPVSLASNPVSMLSISAHKFGGPKGVGALVVRRGINIEPVQFGGGHEWNVRSGTHNVPAAAAMATAADIACGAINSESTRLSSLRDRLEQTVAETVADTRVNGASNGRVANTSNICFDGADGEAVLIALDELGIAASSASACAAAHSEPSYVLVAMGLSRRKAEDSMRFSLGYRSTDKDVDNFLRILPDVIARIRSLR